MDVPTHQRGTGGAADEHNAVHLSPLFDGGIRHEYRLVRGADHTGATAPGRMRDALGFLARVIVPLPPDPALATFHEQVARMKRAAELRNER